MEKNIIVEKKNSIGILAINSGGDLNLISRATLKELSEQAQALDMDDTINAIVIRGTQKVFSAGIDANDFVNNLDETTLEQMYEDFDKIYNLKKPVIAAVSGYALGIGCQIALSCDIILASDNACFGQPDLSVGIVPGFGATQIMPRLVGKAKTMEMILTGRAICSKEAERAGMISRVVPLMYLFEEAVQVAEKVASMENSATVTAKELVKTSLNNISLEDGIEIERQVYKSSIESEDFRNNLAKMAKK